MFWLGLIIGLVVAWNLFPQPKPVARLYERIAERFRLWLMNFMLLACVLLSGCYSTASPALVGGHARERAMAEIAIAFVTADTATPDNGPSVGDKCPSCNDPPGACGVGKVGDGRDCDTCGKCNGDGRIDERDLAGSQLVPIPVPDPVPDNGPTEPVRVDREIILHMALSSPSSWPSKWFNENEETFSKRGWIVSFRGEPSTLTEVSYFDVIACDGTVRKFYEPLTVEDVEPLEER